MKYENIKPAEAPEEKTFASKFEISDKKWTIMKKLAWVVCLSFLFMVGEALGGYLANSLAVMSDAAHLFSDVCGYALSLGSVFLSTFPKSKSMPFGYIRAEIIGALCSVLMLWIVLFHLAQEGMERLFNPEKINGGLMFVISTCGLCVNLLMGFILAYSGHSHSHGLRKCNHVKNLAEDMEAPLSPSSVANCDCESNKFSFSLSMNTSVNHKCGYSFPKSGTPSDTQSVCLDNSDMDNMNIRAAYVHVIADTMQSFGVVVSSALIWYSPDRFAIVDPLCTLVFAALGFACSLSIMNDIVSVFMLKTPDMIDTDVLQSEIENLDARILHVEGLRVWGLTANEFMMTCRIVTRSDELNRSSFYDAVRRVAKQNGITDTTIQVENLAVKRSRKSNKFSLVSRKFI